MEIQQQELIREEINKAHYYAEEGQSRIACEIFASARTMLNEFCSAKEKRDTLRKNFRALIKEREKFRGEVSEQSCENAGKSLFIIADSLGLPRPVLSNPVNEDTKEIELTSLPSTYSELLTKDPYNYKLDTIAQRFFTTANAANAVLNELPETLTGSDFLLHLGLNDCADRMFLHNERLILGKLEEDIVQQFLGFVRKHRRDIIKYLPARHYVELNSFAGNLNIIVKSLRQRDVSKIVLTTIILPAVKFWKATPNIQRNFAEYNLAIMEVAERSGCLLLDMDRLVWEVGSEEFLVDDGMHLSDKGHLLLAEELDILL